MHSSGCRRRKRYWSQPVVRRVSNPDAFVNQAVWQDPVLYVTVNGGEITADATEIVVGNLETHGAYRVFLGDEVYDGWTHSGTELTIETPALSSQLLKIRVVEAQ